MLEKKGNKRETANFAKCLINKELSVIFPHFAKPLKNKKTSEWDFLGFPIRNIERIIPLRFQGTLASERGCGCALRAAYTPLYPGGAQLAVKGAVGRIAESYQLPYSIGGSSLGGQENPCAQIQALIYSSP